MTTLYRLLGANQELIYVGISDNYNARIRTHAEKAWFPEVRMIETEEYETRKEAKAAETAAIKGENPKYNRSENPAYFRTREMPLPPQNVSRGDRVLLSMNEAAIYANVSTKTLRRRIADGSLRAFRVGPKLIRIDRADLDALFGVMQNALIYR